MDRAAWLRRLPALSFFLISAALVGLGPGAGRPLEGQDYGSTYSWSLEWMFGGLLRGEPVTWNPRVLCGFPLTANLLISPYYPLHWAAAALSMSAFWSFSVAAHQGLAGLLAFLWLSDGLRLRRPAAYGGALVYMLSGHFVLHVVAGHLGYLAAYAWIPAILWRTEKLIERPDLPRTLGLAGAQALLLLTGALQYGLIAVFASAGPLLLHGWRHRAQRRAAALPALLFVAAGLFALAFAAPHLLPGAELAFQSHRDLTRGFEFSTDYSFPPENLPCLVAPEAWGSNLETVYWGRWTLEETCGSFGAVAALLALLGGRSPHPQKRLWAIVAVLGVLLALGRSSPLFLAAYHALPGFSFFRAPARYLVLTLLGVSALAALGLERLEERPSGTKTPWRITAAFGTVLFLPAFLLLILAATSPAGWRALLGRMESLPNMGLAVIPLDTGFVEAARAGCLRSAALAMGWLAVAGSCIVLARRGRIRGPVARTLVVAALLVELGHFTLRQYQPDLEPRGWPPALTAHLRSNPGFRVTSAGESGIRDPGRGQEAGIDHAGGYEAMALGRYAELMNVVQELPVDEARVLFLPWRDHPALDMLGVRFRIAHPRSRTLPHWRKVAEFGGISLYETPQALPRAFVVPRAVSIPSKEERLKYLASRAFFPRSVVVVEEPVPEGPVRTESDPAVVRTLDSRPGRYRLEAESREGGYLVLTESFYPGWRASLDGTPVDILRANHLVQAVVLPPGRHEVEFVYASRLLPWGFGLCLLSLAAAAGLLVRRRLLV